MPSTHLFKKNTPFVWTEKQQMAFDTSRKKSCEESLLQRTDFSTPFILSTAPYWYVDKPTAYTDNKLSVWFQNSKDPCSRVIR